MGAMARLAKFNPHHDELGRFARGGTSGIREMSAPSGGSAYYSWRRRMQRSARALIAAGPYRDLPTLARASKKIAAEMGARDIKIGARRATMTVGPDGRKGAFGGQYDSATHRLEVFQPPPELIVEGASSMSHLRGIVAHEVTHHKFALVTQQIEGQPQASDTKAQQIVRAAIRAPWEYEDEDGMTEYSRAHWNAPSSFDSPLALEETLAEIAKVRARRMRGVAVGAKFQKLYAALDRSYSTLQRTRKP